MSFNRRLQRDYIKIMEDPIPYVKAHPLPQNILEWHFAVLGPEETPYEGGVYHGKLIFPREYPFKPPSIYMITPNGRFQCNTRLCLSISDFHPSTWNPSWSVATILTGLLSFMVEKHWTVGSIKTSEDEKRLLARSSLGFNLKDSVFCELFPDQVEYCKAQLNSLESENSTALDGITDSTSESKQNSPFQKTEMFLNAAVVLAFAFFAYGVRYVLQSI